MRHGVQDSAVGSSVSGRSMRRGDRAEGVSQCDVPAVPKWCAQRRPAAQPRQNRQPLRYGGEQTSGEMDGPVNETMLVNLLYCHPVGHAIEALRYCLGYHRGNPDLRISLILNKDTPTELAGLCSFVQTVYPISHPLTDPTADAEVALERAAVPHQWDWVMRDGRGRQPAQREMFPGLARYSDAADRYFDAGLGRGNAGGTPPEYVPDQRLALELPESSRARVREVAGHDSSIIAVMPAGSGPRWLYPSVQSWRLMLAALTAEHPDALICFIGKHRPDGRTRTSFGVEELFATRAALRRSEVCFDLPLLDQLAIVERSRLFLAPHTGFGMAALAVGTPWLAISGNRWHEYFFNGVPFYSVLPDPVRFPCFTGMGGEPPVIEADTDGEGQRSLSMSAARIKADLPELLHAAAVLINEQLNYDQAMEDHFRRLRDLRDLSSMWSFDEIHRRYV